MKWFRVYSEARTDAKLESLSDAQHRVWFRLMCFAGEQSERGEIVGYDEELLAIEVARGDVELLRETLERLIKLRIIAAGNDDVQFINWEKRQYDKPSDSPEQTRERKRRSRAASIDSDDVTPMSRASHADVTPRHDPYTDTDTDTELSENSRSPLAAAPRKTRPPTPVPKPIEQDRQNPIWDALAAETGKPATKNERSDFGETVSQLRDAEATPDEIHAFPNWWYESFPGAKLTHRCYREHLGKFRSSPPRPMLPSDIKNPMVRAALTTDMSDITAELEAKHGSRNGLSIENRNPRELFAEPRRIAAGEPRAAPHVLPEPRQPERS